MRDPDQLIVLAAEMSGPFERYLKWKQISERYERGRHSVLARIVNKLRTEAKVSQAQLESMAYASDAWRDYEDQWDAAERKMISYRVKYENLRCQFDALQSALSWDREGMKRGVVG